MSNDKKWFCYILSCSDNSLYTGITNNLNKRLAAHNSGKGAKYTKLRTPVKLVYYEELENRSTASKREAAIKKLKRIEKLKIISEKKSAKI
jgi:putative endonuclease